MNRHVRRESEDPESPLAVRDRVDVPAESTHEFMMAGDFRRRHRVPVRVNDEPSQLDAPAQLDRLHRDLGHALGHRTAVPDDA